MATRKDATVRSMKLSTSGGGSHSGAVASGKNADLCLGAPARPALEHCLCLPGPELMHRVVNRIAALSFGLVRAFGAVAQPRSG
jgi:hypothetical protein